MGGVLIKSTYVSRVVNWVAVTPTGWLVGWVGDDGWLLPPAGWLRGPAGLV